MDRQTNAICVYMFGSLLYRKEATRRPKPSDSSTMVPFVLEFDDWNRRVLTVFVCKIVRFKTPDNAEREATLVGFSVPAGTEPRVIVASRAAQIRNHLSDVQTEGEKACDLNGTTGAASPILPRGLSTHT